MTEAEFKSTIGKLKTIKQKQINEIYWWASLSINALDNVITDENLKSILNIKVPSSKTSGIKEREIKRTVSQGKEILEKAKTIDIYYSVFVFIVAKVEDFLSQITFITLKNDPRRIKSGVSGVDMIKKFDVDEILDSDNKEEIIDKIIKQNLVNLFYAGPSKLKEYFNKVLGIKISDDLWDSWFEFKASRDVIIHNSGIINSLYISKSGSKARGKENDILVIDKAYFSSCIALTKSLIGHCAKSSKESLVPKK